MSLSKPSRYANLGASVGITFLNEAVTVLTVAVAVEISLVNVAWTLYVSPSMNVPGLEILKITFLTALLNTLVVEPSANTYSASTVPAGISPDASFSATVQV